MHVCVCVCVWGEWVFPWFDLSSVQKQAKGLIAAMIPCQVIIYIALFEDADLHWGLTADTRASAIVPPQEAA